MQRVKRTAISLRPKQPYLDWANGLEDDGVKIGGEFAPEENIYLIQDSVDRQNDLEALLEPYYETIFEENSEPGIESRLIGQADATYRCFWPDLRWTCIAWCLTWSAAGYVVNVTTGISRSGQAVRR